MIESISSVLPWICLGIIGVLYAADYSKKKKAQAEGRVHKNSMTECMCLGLCLGIVAGGQWAIYGALIGLIVGMNMTGKKKEQEQE